MKYLQDQKGAILVLFSLMLVVLLLFVGLVIDVGNLYVQRIKMQNTADAAVGSGALQLSGGQALAITAAKTAISKNGFNQNIATIDFNVDTVHNKGGSPEINVTLTQNVPTYFMLLAGFPTVKISVLSKGITSGGGGPFGYGVFSGGTNTLNLNYATYKGSVYSGGNLNFNGGGIKVEGSVDAIGSVTGYPGNGNTVTGSVKTHTTPQIMPDYTSLISSAATKYNAGGGTYSLNGTIANSAYVTNGNVTIGNTSTTTFSNTEVIMADGNITINSGNVTLGGSNQIFIYSRTGNITFNGGGGNWNQGTVVAYAPNGTINTGGGNTPFRSVVAKAINISGGSINVNSNIALTSLVLPSHVAIIN